MLNTLYSKLALALALLFCVIGLLFLFVMRMSFTTYHDAVTQKLNKPMAAQLVSEHVESKLDAGGLDAVRKHFDTLMLSNPAIELYLLDEAGNILAFYAPKKKLVRLKVDLAPLLKMLAGDSAFPILGDDPRDAARKKIFSVARIGGRQNTAAYLYAIIGGEQYDTVADELANSYVLRQGVWIIALGLLFATLAGLMIFAVLTGKLRRLTSAMDAFRRSDFREIVLVPAHSPRGDEIDRLADTFNAIAERVTAQLEELQRHDEARRDMLANVSHDLRTPIASLRGYLETMLLKQDSASREELRNYLEIATRQSERLAALVSELFELAKLEASHTRINPEPFQLAELAHDVLHKFELEAQKKRVRLVGAISPEAPFVRADIGLIERVLQNLLENALRHTPEGGEVRLSVAAGANGVTIEVQDTGTGIPEAEIPLIFDRFYRVDKSRNMSSGGTGLGLAITKRILDLHQSAIAVEGGLGRGSTFRFTLQLNAQVI
jgi:signal transduction histidine kinase